MLCNDHTTSLASSIKPVLRGKFRVWLERPRPFVIFNDNVINKQWIMNILSSSVLTMTISCCLSYIYSNTWCGTEQLFLVNIWTELLERCVANSYSLSICFWIQTLVLSVTSLLSKVGEELQEITICFTVVLCTLCGDVKRKIQLAMCRAEKGTVSV